MTTDSKDHFPAAPNLLERNSNLKAADKVRGGGYDGSQYL